MPEEQFHIDWEKLIAILEKPAAERKILTSALTDQEQEVVAWMQQQQTDKLLTGALQLDTVQAWKHTMNKIGEEAVVIPLRKTFFAWKRWVAAACLLITAGAGWLIWKQYRPASNNYQTVAQGLANHTPSGKVQLVTADGKTIEVDAVKQLREKDGTVIQLHEGQVTYNNSTVSSDTQGTAALINTLIVPRGYMYTLTLADGSKVWLNADSRIHYPVHFDKTARKVEIEGEAYFEVVHNEQWPFIVKIAPSEGRSGGEVKVLGTTFDVKAYGNNIFTTLVTGRVQFSTPAANPVKLSPDHQAVFNSSTGTTETRKVIAGDWIAWKDDDLVMIKMSLTSLAEILERRYDVQVSFTDEKLKAVQYNGALHLTGNVIDVLNSLEETGNIHFAVKDKKIFILPADEK